MALIRTNHGRAFRAALQTPSGQASGVLSAAGTSATAAAQERPHDTSRRSALAARRLEALRKALVKIEVQSGGSVGSGVVGTQSSRVASVALPFGISEVDHSFPDAGLADGAVHEVMAASARDRPASLGFAVALLSLAGQTRAGTSVVIVSRASLSDYGLLHGHGLFKLGADLNRLLLVETRTDADALWAMEETLRAKARLSMVLGLIGSGTQRVGHSAHGKRSALANLTTSRRLALAAATTGTPLVLSLPHGCCETSAAATRWRIAATPSCSLRRSQNGEASLRRSRFRAVLERCRNGRTGEWILEWDHAALRFSLAQELAARAPSARAAEDKIRERGGRLLRFA